MTLPGDPNPPAALIAHREAVWGELGREPRTRYDAFSSAARQELSATDALSTGVSLSTELSRNLPLYEHFGYRVRGHARVGDTLETWTRFRPVR